MTWGQESGKISLDGPKSDSGREVVGVEGAAVSTKLLLTPVDADLESWREPVFLLAQEYSLDFCQ